jgi:hypothetical protein
MGLPSLSDDIGDAIQEGYLTISVHEARMADLSSFAKTRSVLERRKIEVAKRKAVQAENETIELERRTRKLVEDQIYWLNEIRNVDQFQPRTSKKRSGFK